MSNKGSLQPPRLLAVCGSMKPAAGRTEPSACRELLRAAVTTVHSVFPNIDFLDVREEGLPPFQGLSPGDHPDPRVRVCHDRIRSSSGVVLSVPAYWGAVGGAFKTFVETVSGPPYSPDVRSPFHGLPTVAMLVGAELGSARAAAGQLLGILNALGAIPITPLIIVDDPAAPGAASDTVHRLVGSIAALAREIAIRQRSAEASADVR